MLAIPTPSIAQNHTFSPDSRVWIYVAERPLTADEAQVVSEALAEFTQRWTAHNQSLQATGELFQQQIILLMVDETHAGASGCSPRHSGSAHIRDAQPKSLIFLPREPCASFKISAHLLWVARPLGD